MRENPPDCGVYCAEKEREAAAAFRGVRVHIFTGLNQPISVFANDKPSARASDTRFVFSLFFYVFNTAV